MTVQLKPGMRVRFVGLASRDYIVGEVAEGIYAGTHPLVKLATFDNWYAARRFKPVVRVPMGRRVYAPPVPDNAMPGDIITGNRGARAEVVQYNGALNLEWRP